MGGDGFIVFRFYRPPKGKAGITEVMEYRAAAAATAGQTDVIFFQPPRDRMLPPGFARPITTVSALRATGTARAGRASGGKCTHLDRPVKPGIVRVRNKQAYLSWWFSLPLLSRHFYSFPRISSSSGTGLLAVSGKGDCYWQRVRLPCSRYASAPARLAGE